MLRLERVTKIYNSKKILDQVSLEIRKRELVILLGPSGSGKTTLLRLIAGFEQPDEGKVWIRGKMVSGKIKSIPPHKRNFGMVFQDLALWPHMTVKENVSFGLRMSKRRKEGCVKDVLRLVHLDKHWNDYPHQLSGGENQRAALARALVQEPEILLMDEPLSNLDVLLKDELQALIVNIHKTFGITTVYVTHNQIEAKSLDSSIAVIDKGKIEQIGSYRELLDNPKDDFIRRFVKAK